jgi:hypothetical protein
MPDSAGPLANQCGQVDQRDTARYVRGMPRQVVQQTAIHHAEDKVIQNTKFNFGDEVKSKVTGYRGVVTATTHFMNGCVQYAVRSQKLKDHQPLDSVWIDVQELELVKACKVEIEAKQTGGPATGLRMPKA